MLPVLLPIFRAIPGYQFYKMDCESSTEQMRPWLLLCPQKNTQTKQSVIYLNTSKQNGEYIMENRKKVLLFHVKKEKMEQIKSLCREFEIDAAFVDCRQYLEPLGVIAGIQGIPHSGKVYQGEDFPMEMMVFSGIPQELLDVFLKKYREYSIEPIALKAIITPTNIFWNAQQLYQELAREHMSFFPRS